MLILGSRSKPLYFSRRTQRSSSPSCSLEISANVSRDPSLVFSYLTQVRRCLTLPPAVTAAALALFPRKRRTLARNVGSGGREAVETHGGGKGGLPGWEAFHFLGDFRQTRRFRHIGADADATVDVESVRVPALPGSGSGPPPAAFTPAVPTVVSTRASTHASGRTESFRSLSPTFSFRFRSCHPPHPSAPPAFRRPAGGALPSNSSATPATPLTLLALLPLIVSSLMRSDRKRIV